MLDVDRVVRDVLRQMRSEGRSYATAKEVMRRLPRNTAPWCPNDGDHRVCSVGVLGAMGRVKDSV